jgi:hypothetical protein
MGRAQAGRRCWTANRVAAQTVKSAAAVRAAPDSAPTGRAVSTQEAPAPTTHRAAAGIAPAAPTSTFDAGRDLGTGFGWVQWQPHVARPNRTRTIRLIGMALKLLDGDCRVRDSNPSCDLWLIFAVFSAGWNAMVPFWCHAVIVYTGPTRHDPGCRTQVRRELWQTLVPAYVQAGPDNSHYRDHVSDRVSVAHCWPNGPPSCI